MTFEIGLLLLIIGIVAVLLATEWLSPDITAPLLLVVLVLTGLLPIEKAFRGFGSETFVLLLGLFVMSAALVETGVIEFVGRRLLSFSSNKPERLLVVIMCSAALLSSFMSNTAATAFFLPAVFALARKSQISPSRFLMPLAFASILAGTVTVVSSSTNIVINGVLSQYHLEPFSMFELAPMGIPIAVAGIAYMLTIGKRLVPDRRGTVAEDELKTLHSYLSEVVLEEDSPLVGKTLGESGLERDLGVTVLRIIKGDMILSLPRPWTKLEPDDLLLVEANREDLLKVKDELGLQLKGDVSQRRENIDISKISLAEGVILPGSNLIGNTLRRSHFRQRYNCQVLGLNRREEEIHLKLGDIPLQIGDIMLIQGEVPELNSLNDSGVVKLLSAVERTAAQHAKAPIAFAIFFAALAIGSLKWMPLSMATLLGAVGMFMSGALSPQTAYRRIEWRALILIACMLGLGEAMQHTGTERYLASGLVAFLQNGHEGYLISAFFVLAMLLTQPLSNQAAAILLTPIAIESAVQFGMDPRALAAVVAVGANCSFLTPLEPSCLLVYGPGNYRFMDFVRVGLPLTVLIYLLTVILVPMIW